MTNDNVPDLGANNGNNNNSEGGSPVTTVTSTGVSGLTYDQESFLKQQLIKYSVEEEVKLYFTDSNLIEQTLFLNFLFSKLTTIPLLNTKDKAKQKFKELINTLPKIIIQSGIATKKETNSQFRKFVVKCFDVALRTPQEKIKDKKLRVFYDPDGEDESEGSSVSISGDDSPPSTVPVKVTGKVRQRTLEDEERDKEEEERRKNPFDIERDESIAKLQEKLTELTSIILERVEKSSGSSGNSKNGVNSLFNIILQTPNINDLPEELKAFNQTLIKIMALWLEREMRDQKQVRKLKRLYMVTPVKAIKASLALANPITLLKGIIMLFLAKPFGTRNLIQTLCSVFIEYSKTDRMVRSLLKKAESDLSVTLKHHQKKQILAKVKSFVYNMNNVQDIGGTTLSFKEIPATITLLQYQWEGSPPMDMDTIAQMEEEQFKSLFEYAKMELRKKEKNDFVEVLGNDEMIDIIRELLPVLYEPLGKIFCKANIGNHFEKLAHVMKKLVVVAETGELISDDKDLDNYDISDDDDDLESKMGSEEISSQPNSQQQSPTISVTSQTSSVTEKKSSTSSFSGWFKSSFTSINKKNVSASNLNSSKSEPQKLSNSISSPDFIELNSDSPPISAVTPSVQSPYNAGSNHNNNNNNNASSARLGDSLGSNLSSKIMNFTNDINSFINSPPENREKSKDLKRKYKKHKNQSISLVDRLFLFEEVCTILMERLYSMIHELVKSDAKTSYEEELKKQESSSADSTEPKADFEAGLLSQSVSWLLGILQFLKDEEVDVYTEIFSPLSPPLKDHVIDELEQVIKYRKWRLDFGNDEANKKDDSPRSKDSSSKEKDSSVSSKDKAKSSQKAQKSTIYDPNFNHKKEETKEEEKEISDKPAKPVLTYVPTLTSPFVSLMSVKFEKISNPTFYSLSNLSSMIGKNNFVMK